MRKIFVRSGSSSSNCKPKKLLINNANISRATFKRFNVSIFFAKAVNNHLSNQSGHDTRIWYHKTAAIKECPQAPFLSFSPPYRAIFLFALYPTWEPVHRLGGKPDPRERRKSSLPANSNQFSLPFQEKLVFPRVLLMDRTNTALLKHQEITCRSHYKETQLMVCWGNLRPPGNQLCLKANFTMALYLTTQMILSHNGLNLKSHHSWSKVYGKPVVTSLRLKWKSSQSGLMVICYDCPLNRREK